MFNTAVLIGIKIVKGPRAEDAPVAENKNTKWVQIWTFSQSFNFCQHY